MFYGFVREKLAKYVLHFGKLSVPTSFKVLVPKKFSYNFWLLHYVKYLFPADTK